MHTQESILDLTRDEFDDLDPDLVQNKYVWWVRSYYASVYQTLGFHETYRERLANMIRGQRLHNKQSARVLIFDNQHYLGIGDARNSHLQCIVEIMREARARGMQYVYTLCAEPSAWPFEKPPNTTLAIHLSTAIQTLYREPCTADNINDLEPGSRFVKIKDYPYYLVNKILDIAPAPHDVVIGIGWGSFAFHNVARYMQAKTKILAKLSMDIKPGNFLESGYHITLEPGLSAAECFKYMRNDLFKVVRIPYDIGLVARTPDSHGIYSRVSEQLSDILGHHSKGFNILILVAALNCQQRINADFMALLQELLNRGYHLLIIGITDYDHPVVSGLRHTALKTRGRVSFMPISGNIESCFKQIANSRVPVAFLAPHHTGNGRTILTAVDAGIPVFIKPPSDAKHRLCEESCYNDSSRLLAKLDAELLVLATRPGYQIFPAIVQSNIALLRSKQGMFNLLLGRLKNTSIPAAKRL